MSSRPAPGPLRNAQSITVASYMSDAWHAHSHSQASQSGRHMTPRQSALEGYTAPSWYLEVGMRWWMDVRPCVCHTTRYNIGPMTRVANRQCQPGTEW